VRVYLYYLASSSSKGKFKKCRVLARGGRIMMKRNGAGKPAGRRMERDSDNVRRACSRARSL
jgi:hypothetical protein